MYIYYINLYHRSVSVLIYLINTRTSFSFIHYYFLFNFTIYTKNRLLKFLKLLNRTQIFKLYLK